jgi:hypothetical protein
VCFDAVIQVANNQPVPFILGGDALGKVSALVDYRTGTITPQVAEQSVDRLESPVPSEYKAFKFRADLTLAPQSSTLVRVANE